MSGTGLVVLVLVVTITLVILARSIPSYLASREPGQPATTTAQLKANEAAVISALRSINRAEAAYLIANGGTYGTFLDLEGANLLDQTWTDTPVRNGYRFTLTTGTKGYCVTAERTSNVGIYSYSMSHQGAIYYLPGDTAPPCDPDTGLISLGTAL